MLVRAETLGCVHKGKSMLPCLIHNNKAEYSALDASLIVPDGPTDLRTDGPKDGLTDGRTDKPFYRDAKTHLKIGVE